MKGCAKMTGTWDEKLSSLSCKLEELSQKAAEASEDARISRKLHEAAVQEKLSDARGNMAAMQENVRIAGEERQTRLKSALLKARMTVRTKLEDRRDVRDRRRLEHLIDDELGYILECYDSAAFLLADAELTILEVAEVIREYDSRFGNEDEAP